MQSALVSRTFTPSTAVMLALVLTLAACSSKQPNKVLNSGSGGITIEYDTRYPTMAGVDADEHCAKFGKVAKRVETKKRGYHGKSFPSARRRGRFRVRESGRSGSIAERPVGRRRKGELAA